MAQVAAKILVDVVEVKLAPSAIATNPFVIVTFGRFKRKTSKVKKRTAHPVFDEVFEFLIDLENPSDVLFQIVGEKKKSIGTIVCNLKELSPTNKAKEHVFRIVALNNEPSPGTLTVRFTLSTGPPAKPTKKKTLGTKTKNKKAAKGDEVSIFTLIKKKDYLGLEDFLINCTNEEINFQLPKSGNTPLHEALLERAEECVPLILNHPGVNVNIPNSDKNMILHYFCEKWENPSYLESFNLLMKKGANVNAVNYNGETPIFKSIFNHVIRTLLIKSLIEHGADVNVRNDRGAGVLHYAVHLGRSDLVNLLLRASPRLDLKGAEGHTPLELARDMYKNQKISRHLQDVETLFNWMDENDFSQYKGIFIQNEISMSLLPDLTEEYLSEMGVDSWGARKKIMKAVGTLANTLSADDLKRLNNKDDVVQEKALEELEKELAEIKGDDDDYIINGKQLEYLQLLGAGASGEVFKGLYHGKPVAIKLLKDMALQDEVDEFKKEFEILSKVRHPNVVFFYGASTSPKLCMVMEYCTRGSLYHAMQNARFDIGWERGLALSLEIVAGLDALHQRSIFHRDLKSLNILVTQEWHAKLCDFGLSRFNTTENVETMKQMRGTFAYVDPEVYNGGLFTSQSDHYSLGIILWEIANRVVTGKYSQPYSEYKHIQFDFQIIVQAAKSDLRPTIPVKCPPPFKELITTVLQGDVTKRPSLDQTKLALEAMSRSFVTDSAKWNATTS
eukprot:TRINITY_DN5285_c0_g1_i2.p1 TRINITY_DN5285_c0_g1~~TRINITY_DN5285_c0_g1_i2.p1  ORF type:complete len:730 (-),score=158.21 TRINITY_DN5285_c0_g1_i2:138-2327(-)